MTSMDPIQVYFSKEELGPDSDLYGWDGPGWYFWESEAWIHGPFSTREKAAEAMRHYDG
jgi:hypothetical protein